MANSIRKSTDQELTPSPAMLLQKAVEQNFDIDKLKQLMDLQERWEANQAKKAFLAALSKFQTLVPVLSKTKTAKITSQNGGSYSYRYSDLGTITAQIKEAMNVCGLSYRWEFDQAGDKMKVTCIISHVDGHAATSSMEANADASGGKNAIQQKGSTHTYLQRYTLIGALGLSTADDDNDGKTSSKFPKQDDADEDDILETWKQAIVQKATQQELTAFYLQNKKAVDKNEKVKSLFKEHEAHLKSKTHPQPVVLP
ncbi:MAG: hypothetical protein GXC72_00715 [Chitinophagaceae bacterium]|nr:hypothetical protein [Chitinophagaceae bacterium]